MRRYSKYFLLFVSSLLWAIGGVSQTKEELEQKRKEKEKEIAYTKNLISQTNEKQKETLNYLNLLSRKIKVREELIQTILQEIDYLSKKIQQEREIIGAMEDDLSRLREEYKQIVEFAYKTRSRYNKLGFIFSAKNFNQAFKRLKFLQYYSRYRKRQIELIKQTQASLQRKVKDLNLKRAEKRRLLDKQKHVMASLENDKQEKKQLVGKLRVKEKELKNELKRKKRIASQLDKAIRAIIKREMEAAKERKKEKGLALTPEAKILSGEFEKNKSHLPWPVDRGFISGTFGRHEHPTLEGVVVNNNGINITTNKEAGAKAIFDGEVRSVVNLRGAGLAVLVRHGEYFTVYSNLVEVFVKPMEKVEARQKIGKVFSDPRTGETELHLEIWKSSKKLDPQEWLAKK